MASGAGLIRAEVNFSSQPRMEAPMWVEIKLTSTGAQLREGAVEFTCRVLGVPQWTYTTQELALTGGTQTYRFLLPPVATREMDDRSMRVRFLERAEASDLGIFPITTQARPGWPLTLAVGPTSARGSGDTRPAWLNCRLERFNATRETGVASLVHTSAAVLEPADFPTDPLGYTAFDAVFLEGKDFTMLKEKSLEALGQWIAAGGGLLVTADAVFDGPHARTLEQWVNSDPKAERLRFGPDGKLADVESGAWRARVGFGRVAVMPQRPAAEKDYDLEPWRRAIAWLWKVRSEHTDGLVQSGQLPAFPARYDYIHEYDRRFNESIDKLTRELLPQNVRVMPRNVVIGLLAGFVLVIGPLDWWLLGRLRARRFTWVLFPVVTAVFTVATMKLARHYLGTGAHRGGLVITDIAPSGEVVRETRIDVLLPDQRGTLSEEIQHALCATMKRSSNEAIPAVAYRGQFPGRFVFERPVQQWSLVLTRQMRLHAGEDKSRMRWDAFTPAMLDKDRPADIATTLAGDSKCAVSFAYRAGLGPVDSHFIDSNFVETIIYKPENGQFALISQFAPSCAPTLTDLPCIERGDTGSSLVIAARREGSDLHFWRRLYLH
jgi:hypothetical protein